MWARRSVTPTIPQAPVYAYAPAPVVVAAPQIVYAPVAPAVVYRPLVPAPVVAPAPVWVAPPGVIVRSKVYIPGRPVRNVVRTVLP